MNELYFIIALLILPTFLLLWALFISYLNDRDDEDDAI